MLNARHIFRLCKQSARCTLTRPAVYFSSNADDSSSERPPKDKRKAGRNKSSKDGGNAIGGASLDSLLNTTYSRETSAAQRLKPSQAASIPEQPAKSDPSSRTDVIKPPRNTRKQTLKSDSSLRGDTQLLMHLKKTPEDSEEKLPPKVETPASSIDLKIKKKPHSKSSEELFVRLRKIAQEVAGPAGPKSNQVVEDLLTKLQSAQPAEKPLDIKELTLKNDSKANAKQSLDLLRNEIVSEEQIYKITPGQNENYERSQDMDAYAQREYVPRISVRDLDLSLFPKTQIGVFQLESKENQVTKSCLRTIERLEQREINFCTSYSPRNWFEQCIQWTDEGKLWHFPINNEQGLEEETAVSFTEHIFLEEHLEGWCPTFGPVRHFMELVCLGLSKNPYLSVNEKVEYIVWYRDYFEKHRDILEAAGTLDKGVTKVPALEAQ